MREIVIDTETTGLDPLTGDRIVEIGAIELENHVPTGRTYHQYVNPERAMPREAFEVHGLGDEFLRDMPLFRVCGPAFLSFVGDARLVIHNAEFDMRFINAELGWVSLPVFAPDRAVCTVTMTRKRYPGAPASLDALCRRFGIDNSARTLHGALLDAEILAAVKRRTEVSKLIGKARMASGGTRLVHSREMKVIERFSELGPEGKDLALLLLRLGRGRLGP